MALPTTLPLGCPLGRWGVRTFSMHASTCYFRAPSSYTTTAGAAYLTSEAHFPQVFLCFKGGSMPSGGSTVHHDLRSAWPRQPTGAAVLSFALLADARPLVSERLLALELLGLHDSLHLSTLALATTVGSELQRHTTNEVRESHWHVQRIQDRSRRVQLVVRVHDL